MTNPIGPILAADELFVHQATETFASPGSSDPSWAEKVCAMAMTRDGSVQIGFGLGKYPNRNVIDGYGALSRGREQITVRASRALSSAPESTVIAPLHYEVLKPLQSIRFHLAPNDCQPIAFDWLFEAALPVFPEERTHVRQQYRCAADLVRYHQIGTASGWIEVDGERIEMNQEDWVSTRDHSWGVRYDVGLPLTDVEPGLGIPPGAGFMMMWCPVLMEGKDGSRYGLHLHFTWTRMQGFEQKMVTARVEHANGTEEVIAEIVPKLRFHPDNRRLLGGHLLCTMADGSERPLDIEVLGDTGVHLGAGLYFGFDGHHHGEWRGEKHVDGERISDCTAAEQARRLHQIRDTVIRVTDPVGKGVGWGNCQPIVSGPWPELGLGSEDWM